MNTNSYGWAYLCMTNLFIRTAAIRFLREDNLQTHTKSVDKYFLLVTSTQHCSNIFHRWTKLFVVMYYQYLLLTPKHRRTFFFGPLPNRLNCSFSSKFSYLYARVMHIVTRGKSDDIWSIQMTNKSGWYKSILFVGYIKSDTHKISMTLWVLNDKWND